MKLSSTLSLIIGSFFVAVKSQEFTAQFAYSVTIADVAYEDYELGCYLPGSHSNHPMVTEACQELQAFLGISNETGQTVYDLLHFYLSPTQPISEDPSCEVIGGEASLSISIGQIQNEEVARETEPLIFRYSNGCVMKTIAKQAGLSHFLPFYETGILPVPPVVE